MSNYDVIIVGSGVVGATAALALAKQTSLQIAILDSQTITLDWCPKTYDHRVSALSLTSQRLLQAIQGWEKITAKRVGPYSHMTVWDASDSGKITFASDAVHERMLGYIVEDNVIRMSLYELFPFYSNLHFIHPVKLTSLQEKADGVELMTIDEQIFSAKLVIAADGAHSWVREKTGIDLISWDYHQTAIVATVRTELAHQQTARQRFLKTGPLAFLPLDEAHSSSIVWSTLPAQAEDMLTWDDDHFCEALATAFAHKLGKITDITARYHFPLHMRHAKNYVKSRIALIGDAAHTIHPLAGQGVNMGLLDAACLVEVIAEAWQKQRDFSSLMTLRRYERWRKGDNVTMLAMIEMLKYFFMSDKKPLQSLRRRGLNFTDRVSFLKNFFINYALGKRGELPRLMRDSQ